MMLLLAKRVTSNVRQVVALRLKWGVTERELKQRVEHPGGKRMSCSVAPGDLFHNGLINDFGSASLEERGSIPPR